MLLYRHSVRFYSDRDLRRLLCRARSYRPTAELVGFPSFVITYDCLRTIEALLCDSV